MHSIEVFAIARPADLYSAAEEPVQRRTLKREGNEYLEMESRE